MMYRLIASASRHDVDLGACVDDVLRQLASGRSDLEPLLPDSWLWLIPIRFAPASNSKTQPARQQSNSAAPAAASFAPATRRAERLPNSWKVHAYVSSRICHVKVNGIHWECQLSETTTGPLVAANRDSVNIG